MCEHGANIWGNAGLRRWPKHGLRCLFKRLRVPWLRFLNTYRTMTLAPQPEFRRLLEEIHEMRLAA